MNTPDFNELIEAAQRLGYDGNRQRIIDRLSFILARNKEYLVYRERRGRTGGYNQTVAEDSAAIAATIKMLMEEK